MVDVPPARLAEIVPARWSETRTRVAAIRRLLREEDQSGPTIMRYARELGISRQMIYKQLRIVREWDKAGDAPPAPTRWSTHDHVADALVRDAVADLGAGAIPARVLERTIEIAAARGVPAPSAGRVYHAMGRRPVGTALARRLSLEGGVVIDAAAMTVSIASEGEPTRAAILVAAFHVGHGDLLAWTITNGTVEPRSVDRVLSGLDLDEEVVVATSAIPHQGRPGVRPAPRRVRPGSVVRAALGASVGRVWFLSSRSDDTEITRVSHHDLCEVIGSVLKLPEAGVGAV